MALLPWCLNYPYRGENTMWPFYAPYLIIGATSLVTATLAFTGYAMSRLVTIKNGYQGANYHMGKLSNLNPGLY